MEKGSASDLLPPPACCGLCFQSNGPAEAMEQIGISIEEYISVGSALCSGLGEIDSIPPKQKREFRKKKRGSSTISFSASLPCDVCGVVAEGIAVVKYSWDPFYDFRKSMAEMITKLEISEWFDLEELLYCYLSLNSSDFHNSIADAFVSVVTSSNLVIAG